MENEEERLAELKSIKRICKTEVLDPYIKELEKSTSHKRKLQLTETGVSGRKNWRDNLVKYFIVELIIFILGTIIGTAIGAILL
jgi:hypothetical protein